MFLLSLVAAQTRTNDVKGLLALEATRLFPSIVKQDCFQGIPVSEIATTCTMKRDGWSYDATDGYNEAPDGTDSRICLQCCNNVHVKVGQRRRETWDLECDVLSESVLASLETQWYGYEFRFARMRDPDDSGIVRCAMGRVGCLYEDTDGSTTLNGRNLSCTSENGDDDFGYCDNSTCLCNIPGSQKGGAPADPGGDVNYDYNDGVRQRRYEEPYASSCTSRTVDQRRFLKGYTLTVEVEEMSTNQGEYWRRVNDCRVDVEEVDELAVGDTFYQKIHVVGPKKLRKYKWYHRHHGLPVVIGGSLLGVVVVYLVIRLARNDPCPTCGVKLVFSKEQCLMCRIYELEMPDPVLLARLRARAKPHRGFWANSCPSCPCLAAILRFAIHRLVALLCRRKRDKVVPSVPSLLYLVDPQLRRENYFERMTRPVSSHEHAVIVKQHLGQDDAFYKPKLPVEDFDDDEDTGRTTTVDTDEDTGRTTTVVGSSEDRTRSDDDTTISSLSSKTDDSKSKGAAQE